MPLPEPGSASLLALLPARAAIFAVDPETAPRGSIEVLADTYRLTVAERQVLERLAAGESPAGISKALCIGMPTVRTHLHRIFDKTGTRRQSELLVLLLGFTPPVQPR
jgi:DNA-binding CsgD family transcriptional regulator